MFDECSMNELMHQQVYNFTIVKLCAVIVCLEKKAYLGQALVEVSRIGQNRGKYANFYCQENFPGF